MSSAPTLEHCCSLSTGCNANGGQSPGSDSGSNIVTYETLPASSCRLQHDYTGGTLRRIDYGHDAFCDCSLLSIELRPQPVGISLALLAVELRQ